MSRLTPEQRILFTKLHNKKVNDRNVLMDEEYIGVFAEAIDKYSDTAHFVYELLQNADDANATDVHIVLKPDRLVFKHNGTKHFDITEKGVKPQGDINAITGIGFSNKNNDLSTQNKIGKFGLGFKSVLQYTDTPEIYDDIFKFKIEDMIVPTLLEYDYPERQEGETLFVLPFKQEKIDTCFKEIKNRLESLDNPLLFLNNLKRIVWRIDPSEQGRGKEFSFDKILTESINYDDATLQRYDLIEPDEKKHVFLFSRDVKIEKSTHKIFVGFYFNQEKQCLITDVQQNIHCFFPTNETFETCFVSHAPFLLTNSRLNLKPSEDVNEKLLNLLTILAADSVVYLRDYGIKHNHLLIDENITDIIPKYSGGYRYGLSYQFEEYMVDAFKEVLEKEPLLLSRNGKYLKLDEAYLSTSAMYDLLSQEQFVLLHGAIKDEDEDDDDYDYYDDEEDEEEHEQENIEVEYNENVDFLKWELRMKIFDLKKSLDIYEDIDDYSIEDFAKDITTSFMGAQKIEWVSRFYTFLRNDAPKFWKLTPQTKATAHIFRNASIIKNQRGEWVPPFVNVTTPNVFIPLNNEQSANTDSGYNFIHEDYLNDKMSVQFFNELELKSPDEYDYITAVILDRYRHERVADEGLIEDFTILAQYYLKVKDNEQKLADYLKILQSDLFLRGNDGVYYRPNVLYFNTSVLRDYFRNAYDIHFLDEKFYGKILSVLGNLNYHSFFESLGVSKYPRIVRYSYYNDFDQRVKLLPDCQEKGIDSDYTIEGLTNSLNNKNINKVVSLFLWNEVIPQIDLKKFKDMTIRYRQKYSRTYYHQTYDSRFIFDLKNFKNAWLYDKDGNCLAVDDIYQEDLAPEYDLFNGNIQLLNIRKFEQSMKDKYGATDDEDRQQQLGKDIEDAAEGVLSQEQIKDLVAREARKIKAELARQQQPDTAQSTNDELDTISEEEKSTIRERLKKELAEEKVRKQQQEADKAKLDKLRTTEPQEELPLHTQTDYSNKQLFDKPADNPTTSSQHKSDTSIALSDEEIAERQEQENNRRSLIAIAEDDSRRYTFEWFNALLELEFQASDEASTSSRGINLVFSKVEKDPNSDRGILLRNPSRYIPRALEEMENISVTFYLPDNLHITITFEVASVQDYVLRLKCKNEDIEQVSNLLQVAYKVYRAEIKTSSPIKLISELQTSFRALNFNDDDSLLDNLNPTIKFVFGPPGTGKTTHLVKNWINKVATRPHAKMLILCPTNKAADVIAKRALETINPKACPENWLYRFVATADDALENHVCTRDSNIFEQPKCCIISTIARFSYDGFSDKKLKEIDWDYIVIDEASMIPLAEIVYPLYRCPAAQIVIAGDPFQIEPIVNEDRWKDENIYTMVNLNDFSNPKTVPVQFDILNLPVQYRAVPSIGRLFSEYAYNGGVSSNREQTSQRKLTMENYDVKSVNFVMFPVDYFSIFEPHKIGSSPIHIYSALFTFEFVKYVARNIEQQKDEKPWRIGVISPYRAQAEVINKLWEQRTELYQNVEVSIGTVHGFQGDECDIIIAVYNPPATGLKRAADRTFVNKKNILNVAISRAQDYLFILMPDRDFEHYDKLETKTIGYIAEKDAKEMTTITSQKLEKVIFNDSHFIEKNTFVTTHQLANVYTAPASLYEVRFDDKSVDIQIQ